MKRNLRATASAIRRIVFVVAVMALIAATAACSGDDDNGNEQAFCGLLSEGVGLDTANQSLADFDSLVAVAPEEIRGSVERLRNSALGLAEIDPLDVEALFNARFDPNAQAAREAVDVYAETTCELDLGSGPPVRVDEAEAELQDYLAANFDGAPWVDAVSFNVGLTNGRLNSIVARYVGEPTDADEPGEVCRALSVYLYTIREGQGTVSVEHLGDVAAFRQGIDASCVAI